MPPGVEDRHDPGEPGARWCRRRSSSPIGLAGDLIVTRRDIAGSGVEPADCSHGPAKASCVFAWIAGHDSIDSFPDHLRNRYSPTSGFGAQPAHLVFGERDLCADHLEMISSPCIDNARSLLPPRRHIVRALTRAWQVVATLLQ
jgi:hypothetical protein